MGLARAAVNLLVDEAAKSPFHGSIATLGRQHVYVTAQEFFDFTRSKQVKTRSIPVELHREPLLASKNYVSDDWLLKSLGFDEVVRIDYSSYENPDFILDLNSSQTPKELLSKFDVVLDSGTLEHVFDIAAGLRHCVQMVRNGGRCIHLTPSSNCVEHGFYSVSPTLFADFYSASGFSIDKVWLCEIPVDLTRGRWNVYDYLAAPQRFIPLGQLNDKIWFTLSVSTAQGHPVAKVPQQSFYNSTWEKAENKSHNSSSDDMTHDFEVGSRSQKLMSILKKAPFMQRLASKGIQRWRRYRFDRSIKTHQLPYPLVGRF